MIHTQKNQFNFLTGILFWVSFRKGGVGWGCVERSHSSLQIANSQFISKILLCVQLSLYAAIFFSSKHAACRLVNAVQWFERSLQIRKIAGSSLPWTRQILDIKIGRDSWHLWWRYIQYSAMEGSVKHSTQTYISDWSREWRTLLITWMTYITDWSREWR